MSWFQAARAATVLSCASVPELPTVHRLFSKFMGPTEGLLAGVLPIAPFWRFSALRDIAGSGSALSWAPWAIPRD